jgi:hypothetical protein
MKFYYTKYMQANWTNAAAECCGMNMALLSVETSAEQTCISQMVEGINIYLVFNWDITLNTVSKIFLVQI